jgi:putative SOS response-associated peptidase YedK
MCYHYTVPSIDVLEKRFHAKINHPAKFTRIFHVSGFTKPQLPVITNAAPTTIQLFTWGLIPHWVKDDTTAATLRIRTLNARAETIHERPAFRNLISSKRCLVLADGFFEWRHFQGYTYPYYIHLIDQQPFAFAGLFDHWTSPKTGETLQTFTIITSKANRLLEQVHNKRKRMPVILQPSTEELWLTANLERDAIDNILVPYDAAQMSAHLVSRLISTKGAKKNVPQVIKPMDYPELPALKI